MKNTNNEQRSNQLSDDQPANETSKTITIDMPEVKDIPGQEHIKVPRFSEMQDVTISSADEEGEGILDDLNAEEDDVVNDDSNVTNTEKEMLRKGAAHPVTDESKVYDDIALDAKDADGDELNEKNIRQDRTGADLDVPGADLDDADENIGEEDEENNLYSQGQ